jgi:RNA polymerase sigma-70 factor (ECF subfamily)
MLMDAATLTDLIARAQRREPAAFDELVDLYSASLYGYFCRLTGSRHDAEDLLQELFVRVVRMIEQYEHDGRFEAWLFRIATNLIRDRVRRVKRTPGLGAQPRKAEDGDPLEELPDAATDQPDGALDRAEQIDRLQTALAQLPEAEREVIMLRHFSQLPFKEVADAMGTPLGTALARAHRGLARLRELMEQD